MPDTLITPPSQVEPLAALQALASAKRLSILETLRDGEHCVCELQAALGMAQPLLSHHLRALREAGLVRSRSRGRWVYYAIRPDVLRTLERHLRSIREGSSSRRAPTDWCSP